MKRFFLISLILASCSSQLGVRKVAYQHALEEARNALCDVRQALAQQRLQIDLLEEKFDRSSVAHTSSNLDDRRFDKIESIQRCIVEDLKKLENHANETSRALHQFEEIVTNQSERLENIAHLKSTLHSISKAIGRTHVVQSGDSLDKIARKYHTSVQSIKQVNDLKSTTIFIGQELKIP